MTKKKKKPRGKHVDKADREYIIGDLDLRPMVRIVRVVDAEWAQLTPEDKNYLVHRFQSRIDEEAMDAAEKPRRRRRGRQ